MRQTINLPKRDVIGHLIGRLRTVNNMAAPTGKHALSLKILAECSTTKARACDMTLPHHVVQTPVFMPVGTQGTLKGLIPEQLKDLNCQIMLGNTYHLGHRPVSYRSVFI